MFIKDLSLEHIVYQVKALNLRNNESLAIYVGEKSSLVIEDLVDRLNAENLSFFGGLFPGIIYDTKKHEEGIILQKIPLLCPPILVKGLSKGEYELPLFDALDALGADSQTKKANMILVDGLTGNIGSFLSTMYSQLGSTMSYFGGGAGSLSLVQKPCLFSNEGFFEDAALVALMDQQVSIGVRHGWKQIMGPFVATRTDNTRVLELNWNKALDVYREVVEGDSGQLITPENFFSIAKGYPFGMKKDYAECIVRDPIAIGEENDLICVGEVPENSVLEILKGERDSLIEAAMLAASDCSETKGSSAHSSFVVDCISRVLFLEDHFEKELEAVAKKIKEFHEGLVVEGILTLGEIASYGDGFLEFFNKTIVVGVFHD